MRNDYGMRPKAAAGDKARKMPKMMDSKKMSKPVEKPLKKDVCMGKDSASEKGTKMMGSKKPKMGD